MLCSSVLHFYAQKLKAKPEGPRQRISTQRLGWLGCVYSGLNYLTQRGNFNFFGLPYSTLMKKFKRFIPWWLGNRVKGLKRLGVKS